MAGTVLSCFSGLGGLDLGLERSGFEIVGSIESDEVAQRSHASNQVIATETRFSDINETAKELRPKDLGLAIGDLGLIVGGPPCQPFSTAGQWSQNGRSGMADPRASTVTAMLGLVERFLPRALVIENVPGFLHGPGSALGTINQMLDDINRRHNTSYSLKASVVDAADYGVPQHRRRVIAIATRDGVEVSLPTPTHQGDAQVTAWDALRGLNIEDVPVARGKWADLLPLVPPGKNYQWLTSKGGGPEIFGYRTRYWTFLLKLDPNQPSWTISASPGPSTGPFHWENRPLAVEELLRLQSFPVDWKFASSTVREKVRLIGNATPPLLAEHIGMAVADSLWAAPVRAPKLGISKHHESRKVRFRQPRLPAKFGNMVGHKAPHAGHGKGPSPRTTSGTGGLTLGSGDGRVAEMPRELES